MTENEVLKYLDNLHSKIVRSSFAKNVTENEIMALIECKKSVKEIQKCRATGTVEECREAGERQKPKVPDIWGDGYDNEGNIIYDTYNCPNCGRSYEVDYHDYKYCPECGQSIDRRDLDRLV